MKKNLNLTIGRDGGCCPYPAPLIRDGVDKAVNRDKIIADILHIPRDFHALGNISINALLRKSGYFDVHSLISVGDIKLALMAEPRCVDEWLAYSSDKRCDSGWYFVRREDHRHVVGFYSSGDKSSFEYDDPVDACSVFIKHEIEHMRHHG